MEDTNAEVVVARKRIEDEKDSNGFIYMCRDMCCCCRPRCRRNDSEPGEIPPIYAGENSALHQHLLHSDKRKNVVRQQPGTSQTSSRRRVSSGRRVHSASNPTSHLYEAFSNLSNEGYYTAVPLLDDSFSKSAPQGLSRPPASGAPPIPPGQGHGDSTSKTGRPYNDHYECADDTLQSDTGLLSHHLSGSGAGRVGPATPAANVGGVNNRVLQDPLEYGYQAVGLDGGEGGDIYATVASGSMLEGNGWSGASTDRLAQSVAVAVAAGNYEVDEYLLSQPNGAALAMSRGLPGERDGAGGGVAGEGQVEGLVGSEGYAYAMVEGRNSRESRDYCLPARDVGSLYAQIEVMEVTSIRRTDIAPGEFLGSGQFGTVYQGEWLTPSGKVPVAVKTLHSNIHESERVRFLQEAAIMCQFNHLHVVKMYGIVKEDPLMIVLELLPKGDLRQNLLTMRSQGGVDSVLPPVLLKYCREIAFGMCYLARIGFVHRDLAARNILVSGEGMCKVADFGMARDLTYEDYYISKGGQIPVKWTAPEAIHFKKYSTASDVWSYGVVMYEIWSLGHKPFEKCTNNEALRKIDKGIRLPPPPGCPREIYDIMINCWNPNSSLRPQFQEVVRVLFGKEEVLLKWSVKDKAVHISACWLGGDLAVAENLHKDLQRVYCH